MRQSVESNPWLPPLEVEEQDGRALDAVANAMMYGFGSLLRFDQSDSRSLDEIVAVQTSGRCHQASQKAAEYLKEHAQLFRCILLLKATGWGQRFVVRDWAMHMYFMAESQRGFWYAGSPANFHLRRPNPLTTVFVSRHLEDVLAKITAVDGGTWPTVTSIREFLTNPNRPKDYIGIVESRVS